MQIPIYRGSVHSLVKSVESDFYFGHDGLGDNEDVVYEETKPQNTHAAVALIEMSKKYPGLFTLVLDEEFGKRSPVCDNKGKMLGHRGNVSPVLTRPIT